MSSMQDTSWGNRVKKIPGVQSVIDVRVVLEDWWFDFYYHVDTSPGLRAQEEQGWPADRKNFHYLPIRPKCAARIFRDLQMSDRKEYTFIDLGSGKGRMLLLAARHGFQHTWGVELRQELHQQAVKNFRECVRLESSGMVSFHMDASQFQFPDEKLVVFFFNPFGSEVMSRVLQNLSDSLQHCFRDVWIVLQESICSDLVDRLLPMRLQAAQRGYRIYRSTPAI